MNCRVPRVVAVSLLIVSANSAIAQEASRPPPPSLTSSDRPDAWKIENALSAGPKFIADHATVMDWPSAQDKEMRVLRERQMAKKPKPSNTEPGLIYMLNGATQHSYTDPFDRTSAAIPIGPHWMILWPFDAKAAGLPTVMRDAGTLVMFAGTPYAHLHVSGSPWDGHEYHTGDRGVWTMTYARPHQK